MSGIFLFYDVKNRPLPWLYYEGSGAVMENRELSQTSEMSFGKLTFIITTHFDETACETAEDLLVRIVSNRIKSEPINGENAII